MAKILILLLSFSDTIMVEHFEKYAKSVQPLCTSISLPICEYNMQQTTSEGRYHFKMMLAYWFIEKFVYKCGYFSHKTEVTG